MPKGPQGYCRPDDMEVCAVTVSKTATGEIEGYSRPSTWPTQERTGWGESEEQRLWTEERGEIAKKAAAAT